MKTFNKVLCIFLNSEEEEFLEDPDVSNNYIVL